MTTAEACQVGVFSLDRGHFDLIIRECRVHLLQPLVLDGMGRQERRMRALHVAGSNTLSGRVSVATSLAWWSDNSLPDRPQLPGARTIRIDFDMASTVVEACCWMTDESAELALTYQSFTWSKSLPTPNHMYYDTLPP